MTNDETRKTVAALMKFAGSRAEALRERDQEDLAKGLVLLAEEAPGSEPMSDEDLARILFENDQDYYGSGAVPVLVAEIKRLRLLASSS